jgi:spoIIIJ-associated protein
MPAQPKEILEKILVTLGFAATVEEHTLDGDLTLNVKTEESGRLIGRQGQTLADLQYVVNRILFQQDQTSPKVMLDVGGYRAQAREALIQKAKDAANKVRRWGDAVELEPLGSFDRRIVHHALREDPDVETYSVEVDGTEKKVLMLRPKRR